MDLANATIVQSARNFIDPGVFAINDALRQTKPAWMNATAIAAPSRGGLTAGGSSTGGERSAAPPVGMTYAQAQGSGGGGLPLTAIAAGVVGLGVLGLVVYKLKHRK